MWGMNKDFILNLKPGHEMDLLVAEKVLEAKENDGENVKQVQSYSTDSSKIWAIIEKMTKRNFQYNITNMNKKHTCSFDSVNTYKRYIAHAETPMEAVCKASLIAMIEELSFKNLKEVK
jgi:hypothetical protein